MSDMMALKVAVDLMHVPSQVRLVRTQALPDGVLLLLRIAAGDAEAEIAAAALIDRPRAVVHCAATFFIEQILFAPDADSYQVLGSTPQASANELRRNVALLLRWLHPDRDPKGERSIFIGRVTAAWNDLKTPERRAAYDKARYKTQGFRSLSKNGREFAWRRRGNRKTVGVVAPAGGGAGKRTSLEHTKGRRGFLHRALSVLFHSPQH